MGFIGRKDEFATEPLERYLALCKRVVNRMQRDGTWPWKDSPKTDDVVESEDNPKAI